ncbi:MAG: phosphate ABC transporter permease [Planctomycetes bacterium SM23_32]|nr:MAG: phosphate ABC transporter permease [Planctomycetes bacterium SM23_32]
MHLGTRKVLDRSFAGLGIFSVVLMSAALLVLLGPIFVRGLGAFVFRATVEHHRFILEHFGRGDRRQVQGRIAAARQSREPLYDMIARHEDELWQSFRAIADRHKAEAAVYEMIESREPDLPRALRAARYSLTEDGRHGRDALDALEQRWEVFEELREKVRVLLGPLPGEQFALLRKQYGQTRWGRAQVKLHDLLYDYDYDYSDPNQMGRKVYVPRVEQFEGTAVEPLFAYAEDNLHAMLLPRWTFYWRFLFDESFDAHFFGGIWPAVLGTLYLTVGTMLIAGPTGIIAAAYLAEYARQTWRVSLIRTCISTLAGVPSIVFGLFGLAFFVNTLHVSDSRSVLAGALTLAVLVLPTVIRASEEAIRAVPQTYKEAALSLGATKWRTTFTVVLPAALPGVLTSIIISMGRAAGETAPIIFTAAVSLGKPLKLWQTLSQPTPALPWNIYNLATEHEAVDEIRHVQYGMVLTLIVMVLALNVTAIILRARISRKLRG